METKLYDLSKDYAAGIRAGAQELCRGNLVIFPTETVYGIGADATNAEAVAKIYAAKGRPSNNPLIAHIWDMSQVEEIACDISPLAWRLMRKFWPGPFTIVLKSRGVLPKIVSGGLDTIAIRMPASQAARDLLKESGKIVVAECRYTYTAASAVTQRPSSFLPSRNPYRCRRTWSGIFLFHSSDG